MEFVTPRVNQQLLQSYVGRNVRLVGKVQQSPNNGQAVLIASDGATVSVRTLPQSQGTWNDQYMEVIGKVNQDLSMDELFSTNFGNNFDLDNHNAVVIFSQNHYEIFM